MTAMFYDVQVSHKALLTPGMVRLTFQGEALADFQSTGIGDEYLRLFFPDEASGEVVLPIISEEGRWTYREDKPPVRCATYTVRRYDRAACAVDIDFVLHEGGVAATWARSATPGSRMTINRPRGLYAPPADMQWQVLMADATGLPALARILEQTPPQVQTRVVVEVGEAEHRQNLPAHPLMTATWIEGGNGIGPSLLDKAFETLPLPSTAGYIWLAAEEKPVRTVRKYVRQTLKLPAERCKLVAYWIEDRNLKREPAAMLPDDTRAKLEAPWIGTAREQDKAFLS
jgi:NADPH-dependent ferric siderophore reductase